MKKFPDWILAAIFTGLVVPFCLWAFQKWSNRRKERLEYLNLYLETKLKIDQVAEKKILQLEEKEAEMSDLFTSTALRYKDNLDECMRATQDSQAQNMELQKMLKEAQLNNAHLQRTFALAKDANDELQRKLEEINVRSQENLIRIQELTRRLAELDPGGETPAT